MSVAAGTLLAGRYALARELGRGGRGVVYLARDLVLERDVAVKVVRPDALSAEAEERFQREARVVARMDHPGIVGIHDFARHEGALFLVMPLLRGRTLRALIAEGELTGDERLEVLAQVADALEHSHALGVVHRDVKPENIMVQRLGDGTLRAKLVDFGLAVTAVDARLTQQGSLVGTLVYLAPEQVLGREADARTDIYSVGAVAYECFVGEPPFLGEWQTVLFRIAEEPPQPPRRRGATIDAELERWILRCLEKDPAARPQRASELAAVFARAHLSTGITQQVPRPPGLGEPGLPSLALGRDADLGELRRRLQIAAAGACQLVLLGGEPGMGKSALVAELEGEAREQGVAWLGGRCVERLEPAFPYQLFAEALQEPLRARGGAARLASLLPELLALMPSLREVPELRALAAEAAPPRRIPRSEACELLARTLVEVGERRPLVLCCEDLHLGDVTLEALQYLFRRLAATPTLLIGIYRSREAEGNPALAELLGRAAREPRAALLELAPLSELAVRRLAERVLATLPGPGDAPRLDPVTATALAEISGGNPFFVVELVRSLAGTGALAPGEDGSWRLPGGHDLGALPESVQGLLEQRLSALAPERRELLAMAAVAGHGFRVAELAALAAASASGMSSDAELDLAIDELVADGIWRERRQGDRLEFSTPLLREACYQSLAPRRRRTLHRRLAEWLESRQEAPEHAATLAHHFLAAQVSPKAITYSLTAGGAALAASRPEEAERLATAALELLAEPGAGEPGEELAARHLLARALRQSGRAPQALAEARRALLLCSEPGAALLLTAAKAAWETRRVEEAESWVERGLAIARGAGDGELLARLLELGEELARYRGDHRRAASRREELDRLRAPREPEQRSTGPSTGYADRLGDLLLVQGDYLAALEAYQTAREERLREAGELEPAEEARYLLKLAHLALRLGRYEEAIQRCQSALSGAAAEPLLACEIEALAGLVCCAVGRYDAAGHWVDLAREHLAQAGEVPEAEHQAAEAALQRTRGNLLLGQGDAAEAARAYLEALRLREKLADRWEYSIALYNVGEAYTQAGDYGAAIGYLDRAAAEKSAIGDRWGLAYTHHARGQIRLDRGEVDDAFREARTGLGLALETGDPKIIALLRLLLGRSYLATDDIDKAEEELQQAMRLAGQAAAQPEVVRARLGLAAVHRERGRLREAEAEARAAHELARDLGGRELLAESWQARAEVNGAIGRHAEAARELRAALEQLGEAGNPYRRCELQLSLGNFELLRGEYRQALAHFLRLQAQAQALGDLRQRGKASLGIAEVHLSRGDRAQTMAALRAATEDFQAVASPKLVAGCQELLTRLLTQLAQYDRAEAAAMQAIRIYTLLGEAGSRSLARMQLTVADMLHEKGDLPREREMASRALQLLERSGDPLGLADAYREMSAALTREAPEEALAMLDRALALARESGHLLGQARIWADRSEVLRRLGRLREALLAAGEEERLLRSLGHQRRLAVCAFHFASLHYALGDLDRARTWAERNVLLSRRVGNVGLLFGLELVGTVATERGEPRVGRAALDEAWAAAREVGHRRRMAALCRARAEHFLACGDLGRAAEEAERGAAIAADLPEESLMWYGFLVAERLALTAARVALRRGDAAAARAAAAGSLATFERLAVPVEALEARLVLLAARYALGEPIAAEAAEEAAAARELALPAREAEALALVAAAGRDLAAARRALRLALRTGNRIELPRLAALRAELAAVRGLAAEAARWRAVATEAAARLRAAA